MNACPCATAITILLGIGTIAMAGAPGSDAPPGRARSCCPNSLLTGCPDDYCRQPMPRIACLPCGQPDDYCRKLPPRVWTLPCGERDDYCRKPWPDLCPPLQPDDYNCGTRFQRAIGLPAR